MARAVAAVAVAVALCAGGLARPTVPVAVRAPATALVGALFPSAATTRHSCSASVLSAASDRGRRDALVLTAAHCLHGSGTGDVFVPGYDRGLAPDGEWDVREAWVDPAWEAHQDPRDDVAVLRVVPATSTGPRSLADVTRGERLGRAPATGTAVTATGYAAGTGDDPLRCTAPVVRVHGYPGFVCHGWVSGTSGSPLVVDAGSPRPVVVGLIGGRHQGGCYEWRSLSSPFGAQVVALVARAESGAPGDDLPSAGGDGC